MLDIANEFVFDYCGSELVFGRGSVKQLGEFLDARNLTDALVVCGSNVGANEAVMGPVQHSLGDHLAGVFDETTPTKSVETVYDGIEAMHETDADVLVAVGGGSSLDIARQMSVFKADGSPLSAFRTSALDGRPSTPSPNDPLTPVVVVPTTFAGADFSSGGSVEILTAAESPTANPIRTSGSVMPVAMIYDPNLFETTPMGALTGSAMNGFNKGLETIYSRNPTPISDATAVRGLRLLQEALPKLDRDSGAMDRAVTGSLLVQFERQTSIIHAFGHGFSWHYPIQQGVIHAVMAPHVLRYLFENGHGRRELLAEALDVSGDVTPESTLAEEIIGAVVSVRDSLGVQRRLRDVEAVDTEDFTTIAEFIIDDGAMRRAPDGIDPTAPEIRRVLEAAW